MDFSYFVRRNCPYFSRAIIKSILIAILGISIFALWFGMNSDRDNVHPILTQLIPAGHCACTTATIFNCTSCVDLAFKFKPTISPAPPLATPAWAFRYGQDDHNTALNTGQCQTAFPGLYEDVDRAVRFWISRGGILKKSLNTVKLQNGMARAMIYNGNLFIIEARAAQEDHRRKILAVLSSIHRALGNRAPNIEFIFSVEDKVEDVSGQGHPLWVLSRKATEKSVWLIPDFGFWAWGNPASNIGPYDQVVKRIEKFDLEDTMPWSSKTPRLVWRGKLSFAPKLRRRLLEVTRNKPWGDVKEIVWSRKSHFISMEDHCKYMFIAHVEGMRVTSPAPEDQAMALNTYHPGRSFSSSFKYRQACRSVIIAHKLQHIQHHHYLLQSSGPNQNFVEVERDFSDLSDKVEELLANPEKAKRIANNNVKIFRERYLTRAAEACYWRKLWEGWASVSQDSPISNNKSEPGLRFESFILLEGKTMLSFSHQA
ncbi:predicted protein [Uncinocarpus reesii 1704]|uniref:Glycosyl transferase CAP10 domain-containing protein n=1 Tax=Uncinocarpus reesii (strain UAMH 1704) TaxID=336963 RepID=C4JU46_UNCRE|nr:uncharacterized protein UREG_05985 [Uncinocarpus reesii 1704]EEP81143.1 predicted protein [Uncinocarpus reesii 1704]